MEKLVDAYWSQKMTYNQLNVNAKILLGAGSETTATWLSGISSLTKLVIVPSRLPSGLTYFLLKNPRALEKLTKEIRRKFESADDITMIGVNSCSYLLACLEESLRIFPPSPATHARYTPPGGITIEGNYVPEGIAVGIPIYAACHSALNFQDPDIFIPERWTGEDRRYDTDRKDAMQPFSLGPRNCIGPNLAYVETKLVITKLLWHFDMVDSGNENWLDQKIYMVWQKPPLMIKLMPVQRV
jgi:cytochrome P450